MSNRPVVYTIGFTQTSAEKFFARLVAADVKKVLDVRLHNTSQLSGFAKAEDLAFFLNRIGNIDYSHMSILAPDDNMLSDYKKKKGSWAEYEARFLDLMSLRRIEEKLNPDSLNGTCLLCSEHTPHHCHRRLVCEYLNSKWDNKLLVRHL